jgi:polyferredoxin
MDNKEDSFKKNYFKFVKNHIRIITLLFFLIIFTIFSLRHYILGGKVAASVDALCPFGGFETLYYTISTGKFIPQIMMSSLVLAIGIIISVIILRKGFCGYVCPFGAIQELIGNLNPKLKKDKRIKYNSVDDYAKYVKYVLLVLIIILTSITGTLIFKNYDPFNTFFHFGKGVFWDYEPLELTTHLIGLSITIFILVMSYFISRFWCKYLCPLGATMNLFSRLSFSRIKYDKSKCINCSICHKKCPMQINPTKNNYIKNIDCIDCNICVSKCPKNALERTLFNKKINLSKYLIMFLILFFSIIVIAKLSGIWESVPNLNPKSGDNHMASAMIKGWMTISEVSDATGVPLYKLQEHFDILSSQVSIPMKELSSQIDGFETSLVRDFVDFYQENGGCYDEVGSFGSDSVFNEKSNDVVNNFPNCPFGIENDSYPGKCGLYTDTNNDSLCDYSQ